MKNVLILSLFIFAAISTWFSPRFCHAQTPPEVASAMQDLAASMKNLNETMGQLGDSPSFNPLSVVVFTGASAFAPRALELGEGLQNTFQNFYALAHSNVPEAQKRVAEIALALTRLADFTDFIRAHKLKVFVSAVGIIASGIVLGRLANEYIFTNEKDRSIVSRLISGSWSCISSVCTACYEACFVSAEDAGINGIGETTFALKENNSG